MQVHQTDLALHSTARSMVACYQEGTRLLTQAYDILNRAEDCMGQAVTFPQTLPAHHYRTVSPQDLKTIIEENKSAAWMRIIQLLNLQNLMSTQKYKAVVKQIQNGEAPELTLENVNAFRQDLTSNMSDLLQESITESFTWLVSSYGRRKFKTNETAKIGPKVIVSFMVEYSKGGWWRLRSRQRLTSLDNVFHLLDGKGFIKQPGNLVTAIETAMGKKRHTSCETEYFSAGWYQKGTLHIGFKREDLLAKFNRIGADGKPHIG